MFQKKTKNNSILCVEKAIDDPDSEVEDKVSPTEANQINVSSNYLFNGEFYSIISNDGKKLIAKCVNCLKLIQGQVNSTENCLSHIKVCFFNIILTFKCLKTNTLMVTTYFLLCVD